ncbi:alpha/beta hydrolase [Actinoplanes sp. NPDC051470]|uniref:alpha/beta hydrolase n=1 Tax=Actinoplanes sp. NPDC051470 TaxID=3157224 RepID=UPI00343FF35F
MTKWIAVIAAGLMMVTPPAAGRNGVDWHRCAQAADDTEGQELDAAGVQCAEVTVPVDHARPGGRTLTVAIARSVAPDHVHRAGILMINLGGPGSPVLGVVPAARAVMGAAGARFDLIGMDPRFAGRSSPIDCGWPESWLPRSAGATRASFDRITRLSRDLARRCTDDRLRHMSSADSARDMDAVRVALGEPKLSYLGYSYGTYLGAVYTQLFAARAGRIVLDSAIDPALAGTAQLREAAPFRQAMLREWAATAAGTRLGATADQVVATVERVYAASARRPLRVGDLRLDDTVVPAIIVNQLIDDTGNDGLTATMLELQAAADGRAATPTDAMRETVSSALTSDSSAVHSAQTAIMCADGGVPRDVEFFWRSLRRERAESPVFAPMAWLVTPCSFAPSPLTPHVDVANRVPALIVQAEKDIGSQLRGARALHTAMAGSSMITLGGARTHGVYGFRQNACVDDAVNAYLTTGRLPRDREVAC